MAVTRLGWDIYDSYSHPRLVDFPWVTGKVRGGDHFLVLDYICRRWNAEVEKIIRPHSWGFSPRPVRGYAAIPSEHSAGVAVDLNAPDHGLGKSGTFSSRQVAAIRRIMADVFHAARWGGEWKRPDEMHVELQGGNALISRVADQIRAGKLPEPGGINVELAGSVKPIKHPTGAVKPQPDNYKDLAVDGLFGKGTVSAIQIVMRAIGTYDRAVDGDWGTWTKRAVQEWLGGLGYYDRAVDGQFGKHSVIALQKFLAKKGLYPASKYVVDGDFGKATVRALQQYLNTQNA